LSIPKIVTFTGLDDCVDLGRVIELSTRYPIEWGILFGGIGNHISNRFPSMETVNKILELKDLANRSLRLSAHFCKNYSDIILRNNFIRRLFMDVSYDDVVRVGKRFTRIQLNSGRYNLDNVKSFMNDVDREVIIQSRSKVFPSSDILCKVSCLHDLSGGKGIIGKHFPVQTLDWVGYAGGIGPDNVLDILGMIDAHSFWIDMESGVRTDDWLDLDKCELVCKKIWGE
jgi:hypothetical protein